MNIPRKNELPHTYDSGSQVRGLGFCIAIPRPDVDDRVKDEKVEEMYYDF